MRIHLTFAQTPRTNKRDEAYIRCRISLMQVTRTPEGNWEPYKMIEFSTGVLIPVKLWDIKQKKVKRTYILATQLNAQLDAIKADYITRLQGWHYQGLNPVDELKKYLKPEAVQRPPTFFEFAETYLKERMAVQQEKSLMEHRTVLRNLREYAALKGVEVDFGSFTHEFFAAWVGYLIELKNTNPTIEKKWRHLKIFLNAATDRGLKIPDDYKRFRMKLDFEQQDIALTKDDLRALRALDLTPDARLARVRDVFLFGCFTGLRFSDLKALKREHKIETPDGPVIRLVMQKTRKHVDFPLTRQALAIWEGYKYELPIISGQKYNQYLKEMGQKAGFVEPVQQVTFRGSERIETTYPRYELLSSHVARRTWATISYTAGVDLETISRCLGHATIEQTRQYLRVTSTFHEKQVRQAWDNI